MEQSGKQEDGTAEAKPKQAHFGGLGASEAGRRGAEARKKKLAERASDARPVNSRTPLDALRDLMHQDPDAYAEGLSKLVKAGDPRSITIMRELFAAKGSVAIPRAEATIRAMSSDDRRALMLELEARGATLPTLPDAPDEHALDDAEGRVAAIDSRAHDAREPDPA